MSDFILPPEAAQPRVAALLACGTNLMTQSWHMPVSRKPFRYAIAMRAENYTYRLLHDRRSFTLNFLPFEHVNAIDRMGRFHGDETDKFILSDLASSQTDANGNLMLDHADFIYECRVFDTAAWGDHTVFIADVQNVKVHDNPSGKLALFTGKGRYMTVGETRQIPKEA